MIIGDGLIASVFNEAYNKNTSFTIFASGVSNSTETNLSEYNREKLLLLNHINKGNLFVYFSTCSVYDSLSRESTYVQHKMEMEQLIINKCSKYAIFRLPQVAGCSGNKNTLMNFLVNKIVNEELFELLDVERNIVDVNDVYRFVNQNLNTESNNYVNKVINFAFPSNIKVVSLVELMEQFFGKRAHYNVKAIKDYSFKIDLDYSLINRFFHLGLKDYILKILSNYYQ